MIDQTIKEDLEFLLNFAPAVNPAQVQPDLVSVCYLTETYEGDVKLAERVKTIVDKYNLAIPENDLADLVE